jgi:class 3 adenylate cyclase/tetratricopeptide (TPR) repeat protein
MDCTSCASANPEGKRFCGDCGAPLPLPCAACGAANPPGKKFCGECGAALTQAAGAVARAPKPIPSSVRSAAAQAERRQLTVVFCDLVDSTALASRLDPEDLRDVIGAYHECVAATIGRFDGFVAKYMGDGVLAYFGYPRAHEDEPDRAVRASLELIDAVRDLKPQAGLELRCRVGIATGLVVVGDLVGSGEAQERGIVGETPNLAARLQALAEPNTVVIGPSTRRLLGNLFEYRDLDAIAVKGFAGRVQASRVLRPSAVQSRFEALRVAALTPLVGREEEIDLLLRRWQRAKDGEGQVVLLSGEPGIGKSRLTVAMQEQLQAEPHIRLRHFCSSHHAESAFYPIIRRLARDAGFGPEDDNPSRLGKLEALLSQTSASAEDVALIADMLSLPDKSHSLPTNLSPQRRKEKTLEALLRRFVELSLRQPMLMIFEDVHWIDHTSLELLELLVERVAQLRVLLIVTCRPEFAAPWSGHAHVTALSLNRLGQRHVVTIVAGITGGRPLPRAVLEQIVDHTDGVPLFVEELTNTVLESGLLQAEADRFVLTGPLPAHAIPTTLHASLAARLDRFAPVREVAQIGAAIGREFSYALLRAVAPLSDTELHDALQQLVASGLVHSRGTPPDAVYVFKHALVQDTAYDTLLRSRRVQLHARIATALEEHFPDTVARQPHLAAHHCAAAGLSAKAILYHHQAGQQAVARSAMQEAVAQLEKGLALLPKLAAGPERDRLELGLQMTLGSAFAAAKGYAAKEAGTAFIRARELAEALDDSAQLVPIVGGVSTHHLNRAQFSLAYEAASDLLRLTEDRNDPVGQARANNCMGVSLLAGGNITRAPAYFEKSTTFYDPFARTGIASFFGQDPHVSARAYLPLNLALLGHLQQAREQRTQTLVEARRLAHPVTLGHSLALAARFTQVIGDDEGLAADTGALFTMASEQSFALFLAFAIAHRGVVLTRSARPEEGIALLEQGIAAYRETDAIRELPFLSASLAEAHWAAGHRETSLRLLDEALRLAKETDGCWCEAELHRLKGAILCSMRGGEVEAESCFDEAIATARQQGAKLWELRAACSLARLWREQAKRTEACELLSPIYNWFTEGFDTSDLQTAKALLDELEGAGVHPILN